MQKSVWLICLILAAAASPAAAQNATVVPGALGYYNDALRFSQTRFGGTARVQGLAGANVALGADVSSAYLNPAGLGLMRRSEASATVGVLSANTNSTLFGNSVGSGNTGLGVTQFGVVFANDRGGDGLFRGGAFAISMVRSNDFRDDINYSGLNNTSSIIDNMQERTDGVLPWDDAIDEQRNGIFTIEGLGLGTFLITPDFQDNTTRNSYNSFIPPANAAPAIQAERITRSGNQSQWNASYGANLSDKLYVGLGVGLASLRYSQTREYSETVQNSQNGAPGGGRWPMDNLALRETYQQEGQGFNATLGLIYRPVDALRVGLSFTTPTTYRISDSYLATLGVQYNNIRVTVPDYRSSEVRLVTTVLNQVNARTINLDNRYRMTTPMRLNAGFSLVVGKKGFITGGAEYVNYSQANFSRPEPVFNLERDNQTIDRIFRGVLNLQLGGEVRLKDFRVRGGYALYPNPVRDNAIAYSSRSFITGGLGWRKAGYFIDAAVVYNGFTSNYNPYTLTRQLASATPNVSINNNRIMLSLGGGLFF
ncbi:MAG: hypothetical protein MUC97_00010 [Bernardetiaceae bacterium]|nr:hypothetical protein [Bernardetiaceae bacterium]